MIDSNPHRRVARGIAFTFYVLAGFVLFLSAFFVLAAAMVDVNTLPNKNVTNARLVAITVSTVVIIVSMIVLFGWRIQRLFGQRRLKEKLVARSAVDLLRLGSLGCGLWTIPSTLSILITGGLILDDKVLGMRDVFVGSSGFVLAIILMLSIAHFISKNLITLNSQEQKSAYLSYLASLESKVVAMSDPATRASIQDQTIHLLPKLDVTLKSALLEALNKLKLLTGNTRVELSKVDFQKVDLTAGSLPHADLREINLAESKLRGATLFKVNLSRANLKKSDLSRARLQQANLRQADFTDAVLRESKLRGADLTEAVLQRADLTDANLHGANLQGANLREADLSGAILKKADLRKADLTRTVVSREQLKEAIC